MLSVNAVPSGGPPRHFGKLHHRQLEALHLLLGEREADQAAPVLCHEVDRVGGHLLGGEHQVALVLTILVVDEDHHLAMPDVVDGSLHALEQLGFDI